MVSSVLSALPWVELVLAILLGTAILLQRSNESGIGSLSGDAGGASYYTKRGFERTLFIATIVLAVLFAVGSLLLYVTK
jgi:protein translocase SecG subunit